MMANDVFPNRIIFKACKDILCETLTPMHYKDMTIEAIKHIVFDRAPKKINIRRQIEDVREQFLIKQSGRYGTVYTGAPNCLAALKKWFPSDQLELYVNTDTVKIPSTIQSAISASFESAMRFKELLNKNNIPTRSHAMKTARGYVIEKHVSDYFKNLFPGMHRPADNDGKWRIACSHDFKIISGNKIWRIDVSGPNYDGSYGSISKKKGTDLHFLCDIENNHIVFKSIEIGETYESRRLNADMDGISPERFIVYLNCMKNGIDYEELKKSANKK